MTPALTPVDTRWEGSPGPTGVTENAKTPGNPGYSAVVMLYESGALALELRARPPTTSRRSDIHEEASVKAGARRVRGFPDIPSASATAAGRHETSAVGSHSHRRRGSTPCRTLGWDLRLALGLGVKA
jgi:hypothetical protein